jgi:hypothetical protein
MFAEQTEYTNACMGLNVRGKRPRGPARIAVHELSAMFTPSLASLVALRLSLSFNFPNESAEHRTRRISRRRRPDCCNLTDSTAITAAFTFPRPPKRGGGPISKHNYSKTFSMRKGAYSSVYTRPLHTDRSHVHTPIIRAVQFRSTKGPMQPTYISAGRILKQ